MSPAMYSDTIGSIEYTCSQSKAARVVRAALHTFEPNHVETGLRLLLAIVAQNVYFHVLVLVWHGRCNHLLIQILPRVFHVYGSLIADRALEARVSRHVLEAFFVDRVTATQHRYRPDGVEEILETDRTVRHHAAFNACMVPPHTDRHAAAALLAVKEVFTAAHPTYTAVVTMEDALAQIIVEELACTAKVLSHPDATPFAHLLYWLFKVTERADHSLHGVPDQFVLLCVTIVTVPAPIHLIVATGHDKPAPSPVVLAPVLAHALLQPPELRANGMCWLVPPNNFHVWWLNLAYTVVPGATVVLLSLAGHASDEAQLRRATIRLRLSGVLPTPHAVRTRPAGGGGASTRVSQLGAPPELFCITSHRKGPLGPGPRLDAACSVSTALAVRREACGERKGEGGWGCVPVVCIRQSA
mmetsp:Transcript_10678/g.39188  ORF Transcript_10678/g.39188 Transcript_10678/m.39188 type:complete len:414 (-) Transcript_10678:33-1274(-)